MNEHNPNQNPAPFVPGPGRTHKQVIILRKDLGMNAGKMVAQGSHASMKAVLDQGTRQMVNGRPCLVIALDDPRLGPWLDGNFAKIGTRVESELDLVSIYEKATHAGLITSLILDSGLTHFNGVPTRTAVAIGPDTNEVVSAFTEQLKLL